MVTFSDTARGSVLGILISVIGLLIPYEVQAEAPVLDYDLSISWNEREPLGRHARHALPDPDRCFCLAQDGQYLWVGTTAGAVRWNLVDQSSRLFKADEDWGIEWGKKAGLTDRYSQRDQGEVKRYVEKWARNAVENIVILAPGKVWAETFNGAMVIQGQTKRVYPSKEEALAALHKTELKGSLAKIMPMDKAGHLWRTHRIGEFFRGEWIIRRFDGRNWMTMPQPGEKQLRKSSIQRIVADKDGNLWGCGAGGIYRRLRDRWENIDLRAPGDWDVSYRALYVSPSGDLWGFAMGRLARFDGKQWKVFRGRGRYREFMLNTVSSPPPSGRPVVWEAADGKLWFDACDLGMMCFDGKTFRATPKLGGATAITTGPSGRTFVSTGQRLFEYDNGKWRKVATPNTAGFRPSWPDGAETFHIYDLHASEDDTLYLGASDGVFRRKNRVWKQMLFAKGERAPQPVPQGVDPRVLEWKQQMMKGILPPFVLEQNYKGYVEGPGRKLIEATNDQLADDIENGTDTISPLISYHRLQIRDPNRAETSLEKRIRSMLTGKGESHWLEMQVAVLGTPAIKPLLNLAKNGKPNERRLAIRALTALQDKNAVSQLLKLMKESEMDADAYLAIARGAVQVGNPEGIELLIKTATAQPDAATAETRITDFMIQRGAREFLQMATREYGDLPGDWSRNAWDNWWKKHRKTWKPTGVPRGIIPPASLNMSQRIAQEIAKRLESKVPTKRNKTAK